MQTTKMNPPQPKIGGLGYYGILVDEVLGTRKQIHNLTNKEKEKFFKSVFDGVKEWKKRISDLDGYGNPYERIGIYTSLNSLFEHRLETLWLNHAYEKQWGVYNNSDTNEKRYYPPNQKQWMKRDIPPYLKNSGTYMCDLSGKQMGFHKSVVNDEQLIPDLLLSRIERSIKDRTHLIHQNFLYLKDVTNERINRVLENFREIDKLVKKHQRQHRELLIEPKIPNQLVS